MCLIDPSSITLDWMFVTVAVHVLCFLAGGIVALVGADWREGRA